MAEESHYERELGGQLLSSVSRSFYLTLKALPRELREPISLAYLLARTADTIADTAAVPAAIRLDCLTRYEALIHAESRDAEAEQALAALLSSDFSPHQSDPAEAVLMKRFSEALAWLRTMHGRVLTHIRSVLRTIIHGQRLDIERFPADGALRSLATAAELDDYTYLVAGCVGEFWTRLCFDELPASFAPGADRDELVACGILFGKGLQLVNILRDLGKDARLGRCYLPQEQWQPLGLDIAAITRDPACLRPVWERWAITCGQHLDSALRYVQGLQHSRLRYATALPLILAVRTLTKLRKASDTELCAGVKISRLDVAKVLFDLTLNNSPEGIAKLIAAAGDGGQKK